MITFERSEVYRKWLMELKDRKARARVLARIDSASLGNFGDCEYIAEGVYEMRIHYGPGYRVYYTRRDQACTGYWSAASRARKIATSAGL